jgi:hypothetical protein
MRIGVSVPDASGPGALARVRETIERAAEQGFASAWMKTS